ncbi:OprO/OprP family phosphate-selective porin [soil metagenome]
MRTKSLMAGVSAAALLALAAGGAHAHAVQNAQQDAGAPYQQPTAQQMTMSDLQDKLEELQRQIDFMKQSIAEQTGVIAPIAAAPKATLANARPGWASADGNFTAQLNGVMHFDAGNYFQKGNLPTQIAGASRDLNGGTNARRARFGFGGKAFGDFDYNFLYEFGGSGTEDAGHIQELWVQYTGFLKPFHVKVGYFEPLVGMEANVSTNSLALLERASPAEAARNVAAGDTRASIQYFGNDDFKSEISPGTKVHWLLSGAVTGNTASTVNSAGAFASQPFDEQLAVIGRASIAPYHGTDWTVHLGANVQYVLNPNDNTGTGGAAAGKYTVQLRDRPELRLDGTRLVDTGALNAAHVTVYGLEAGAQFKNLYVQGEYFKYEVDGNGATPATASPDFDGYYVQASYLLTGESRVYNAAAGAFNGPVVAHPFNWSANTCGAFEIAGRYSDLDLNSNAGSAGAATPVGGVRGGEQKVYGASLNWYVNPIIRFMLQGQHVQIDRLNATGLSLNQSYDTVALRSQLAF